MPVRRLITAVSAFQGDAILSTPKAAAAQEGEVGADREGLRSLRLLFVDDIGTARKIAGLFPRI